MHFRPRLGGVVVALALVSSAAPALASTPRAAASGDTVLTVTSRVLKAGMLRISATGKLKGPSRLSGKISVSEDLGEIASSSWRNTANPVKATFDVTIRPGRNAFTVRFDPEGKYPTKSVPVVRDVPEISSRDLAAGTVGTAYKIGLAATNGRSDAVWSLVSGALPAGLRLDTERGTILGTPTGTGTKAFTVGYKSSTYLRVTKKLSIAVGAKGTDLWTSVAGQLNTVCGTRSGGQLWCWGSNFRFAAAQADGKDRLVPARVGTATGVGPLAMGGEYGCAVIATQLWCWGDNYYGQLGNGSEGGAAPPTQVGAGTQWRTAAAGVGHTCAITTSGELWCWGGNGSGQLGTADTTTRLTPTRVGTAADWTAVEAGTDHTCGLRSGGSLWCWGSSRDGQLGLGGNSGRTTPTRVGTDTWRTVSARGTTTCAIATDRSLWCWGFGYSTDGYPVGYTRPSSPQRVGTAKDWSVVDVADGHICGIRAPGSLWCWGDDHAARVGSPRRVGAWSTWTAVTGGNVNPGGYACGLTQGQLWCWGLNNSGQYGVGDTETRTGLVRVPR